MGIYVCRKSREYVVLNADACNKKDAILRTVNTNASVDQNIVASRDDHVVFFENGEIKKMNPFSWDCVWKTQSFFQNQKDSIHDEPDPSDLQQIYFKNLSNGDIIVQQKYQGIKDTLFSILSLFTGEVIFKSPSGNLFHIPRTFHVFTGNGFFYYESKKEKKDEDEDTDEDEDENIDIVVRENNGALIDDQNHIAFRHWRHQFDQCDLFVYHNSFSHFLFADVDPSAEWLDMPEDEAEIGEFEVKVYDHLYTERFTLEVSTEFTYLFSGDGSLLAVYNLNSVVIFRTDDGSVYYTLDDFPFGFICNVCFSSNNSWIWVISQKESWFQQDKDFFRFKIGITDKFSSLVSAIAPFESKDLLPVSHNNNNKSDKTSEVLHHIWARCKNYF